MSGTTRVRCHVAVSIKKRPLKISGLVFYFLIFDGLAVLVK